MGNYLGISMEQHKINAQKDLINTPKSVLMYIEALEYEHRIYKRLSDKYDENKHSDYYTRRFDHLDI